MKTSFFEQFPTRHELGAHLNLKGSDISRYLRDNLPKESVFQRDILKSIKAWIDAKKISPTSFTWKHGAGVYNQNGLPDLMMVCDGQFFAFEVKRPYIGKATILQEATIEKINAAGGHAAVVSYPSEIKAMLVSANVWREP